MQTRQQQRVEEVGGGEEWAQNNKLCGFLYFSKNMFTGMFQKFMEGSGKSFLKWKISVISNYYVVIIIISQKQHHY